VRCGLGAGSDIVVDEVAFTFVRKNARSVDLLAHLWMGGNQDQRRGSTWPHATNVAPRRVAARALNV
jgi:hypothetical protein